MVSWLTLQAPMFASTQLYWALTTPAGSGEGAAMSSRELVNTDMST